MVKELKQTALEMVPGTILFELILIVFFFFVPVMDYSKRSMIFGVIVGSILCLLLLWNMARSTEETASSGDPEYARKKSIQHALLRKVAIIAVVILFWKSVFVNVLGIVFALFGLKCGAYLQPAVHKYITKRKEG